MIDAILASAVNMNKMPVANSQAKMNFTTENSFGSVFATVTAQSAGGEVAVSSEAFDMTTLLQVLNADSLEELVELVEELDVDIELPQIVEGHLLFEDDNDLLAILTTLMPELEVDLERLELEGSTMTSVDLRELLSQLGELDQHALQQFLANGAEEHTMNFSAHEQVALVAMLQMSSLAGEQLDLMTSQEKDLFAVKDLLANLTTIVTAKAEATQTQLNFTVMNQGPPVQLMAPTSKVQHPLFNEMMAQQTQMTASTEAQAAETPNRANTDMLLKQLQQIFKRSNFGQLGGTSRISIKLYPEHLGQLRIELLQSNGLLTARILASNSLGKEMLESQLHQLRQAFLQQNIQVERIDISQMLTETPYSDREQAFNQQFKGQQGEFQDETDGETEEEKSFEEYMIELEG